MRKDKPRERSNLFARSNFMVLTRILKLTHNKNSGDLRREIKNKLGWGQRLVSKLRPDEVKLVMVMIEKHDEAERRLEHQVGRLSVAN